MEKNGWNFYEPKTPKRCQEGACVCEMFLLRLWVNPPNYSTLPRKSVPLTYPAAVQNMAGPLVPCWICFWMDERLHGRRHKSIRIEWTWERIKWLPTYVLPPSTNSFFSHFWVPWRAFPITAAPQGWTIYNARVDHSYNSRVGNHREGDRCILKWG